MDTEHYLELLMQLVTEQDGTLARIIESHLHEPLSSGRVSANRGCHGNRRFFSGCSTGVGIFVAFGERRRRGLKGEGMRLIL